MTCSKQSTNFYTIFFIIKSNLPRTSEKKSAGWQFTKLLRQIRKIFGNFKVFYGVVIHRK